MDGGTNAIIGRRRFAPPPAPTFSELDARPGLGAQWAAGDNEDLSVADAAPRAQGTVGHPDGWYSLPGPTRFDPPPSPYSVGHGGVDVAVRPGNTGADPTAGLTRFSVARVLGLARDYIVERTAALMTLGGEGGRGPSPVYTGRRGFRQPQSVNPAGGLVDWTRAGPVPAAGLRFRPLTLRHEFLQDAQTLSGLHSVIPKRAHTPLGAQGMIPAHQPLLTTRGSPGSYGSQTEVLN